MVKIKIPMRRSRGGDRALRLFECKNCGHLLRFGASRFGYCQQGTPILNRKSFWTSVVLLLLFLWLVLLIT
jgi:hypothetical protein